MRRLLDLVLLAASLGAGFVLINLSFPYVYRQDVFPRALLGLAGTMQYTFYPATFDRDAIGHWTAVLGDSLAEGMGDGFLDGVEDYSIAHRLHARTGESFLIFGRSGYGNVNAVHELVRDTALYDLSPILPDLERPERILMLFYEGNDLDNNLRHVEALRERAGTAAADLPTLVEQVIDEPPGARDYVDALAPFARFMWNGSRTLLGLEQPGGPPPETQGTPNRALFGGKTAAVPPLQTAGMNLDDDEIATGLRVLEASLDHLQRWAPAAEIMLVYIPAVATIYQLDNPLIGETIQAMDKFETTTEHNLERSRQMRDEIASFCAQAGCALVDTTERLREAARAAPLHGPRDWRHPSVEGYRLIADIILEAIDDASRAGALVPTAAGEADWIL